MHILRVAIKFTGILSVFVAMNIAIISPQIDAEANNLLAWWKFDEITQGSVAIDSSGNNNTVTSFGDGGGPEPYIDVRAGSAVNSKSASFNGEQYYQAEPNGSIMFNEEMTAATWIKQAAGETGQMLRLKPENKDTGIEFGTIMDLVNIDPNCVSDCEQEMGRIVFCNAYIGFEWYNIYSAKAVANDAWTHIACSYDGANLKIHINGQESASEALTGEFEPDPLQTHIGRHYTDVAYFSGLMDDLQIYNVGLGALSLQNLITYGDAFYTSSQNATNVIEPKLADTGLSTSSVRLASLLLITFGALVGVLQFRRKDFLG